MFKAEYAGIATDTAKNPRANNFVIASPFLFLTRQYSMIFKLNRLRKETRTSSD
jgi:hypothetical protein